MLYLYVSHQEDYRSTSEQLYNNMLTKCWRLRSLNHLKVPGPHLSSWSRKEMDLPDFVSISGKWMTSPRRMHTPCQESMTHWILWVKPSGSRHSIWQVDIGRWESTQLTERKQPLPLQMASTNSVSCPSGYVMHQERFNVWWNMS